MAPSPDGDRGAIRSLALDVATVPAPDAAAVPEGFVVEADDGTRIHFLDWGGPSPRVGRGLAGVLLVPGFGESAWSWAPVARRLRSVARVVALDLRGHGLSDAPVDGYDLPSLAGDTLAVVEGAALLDAETGLVLAGHGFGAEVAAEAASLLGGRCGGLVLVDGGWDALAETTDLTPEELLRTLEEPPEVLRSMTAYLADREAFDPPTWDADQERAARETVVELPSRRLVPAIHPHVRDAIVATMFEYRPLDTLAAVEAPIVALVAADDGSGTHRSSLAWIAGELFQRGRPPLGLAAFDEGHNLMRYRPREVAAAIVAVASRAEASGAEASGGGMSGAAASGVAGSGRHTSDRGRRSER